MTRKSSPAGWWRNCNSPPSTEIFEAGLHEYLDRLQTKLNDIGGALFNAYIVQNFNNLEEEIMVQQEEQQQQSAAPRADHCGPCAPLAGLPKVHSTSPPKFTGETLVPRATT